MTGTGRIAVILFNLGGPDRLSAVRPFLFNLFNDPAILGLPMPVRPALAWLLASRRAGPATEIYRQLGGASPLLDNTLAQARALEAALAGPPGLGAQFRTFVAMRYWHPFAREVVKAVKVFDPERILLLPLYPQWSTTTTASSFRAWRQACRRIGLDRPTSSVCCYPVEPGFVTAIATLIRERLPQAALHGRPRVLFSAHGLPRRVIDSASRPRRPLPPRWEVPTWNGLIAIRAGLARWNGSGRPPMRKLQGRGGIAGRCWWFRSRLFPSIRKHWWSWTSNIVGLPNVAGCRHICGFRPSG